MPKLKERFKAIQEFGLVDGAKLNLLSKGLKFQNGKLTKTGGMSVTLDQLTTGLREGRARKVAKEKKAERDAQLNFFRTPIVTTPLSIPKLGKSRSKRK